MNTPQLREETAAGLEAGAARVLQLKAFAGLDGFVDEILHVVDKRESAEKYLRLPSISRLSERLSAAAGRSTNLELVSQTVKLGGNGPIMANALATLGLQVSYLGTLGYPTLHPVFAEFARHAQVHSITEPAYTDALEFEDGKVMLGKHKALGEMTWQTITERFGVDRLRAEVSAAHLVALVNWTMVPAMSEIWAAVQREICPTLRGPRRAFFVDLADPEKRTPQDILRALELISGFQKHFDVLLGLNEKEAFEIGETLGLGSAGAGRTPESLLTLCEALHSRLHIHSLVVHPTALALASGPHGPALVEGPYTPRPKITTGAGDHFNGGFCLGRLLDFSLEQSLLTGVATSGYYVRTGRSPSLSDLVEFLRNWPA